MVETTPSNGNTNPPDDSTPKKIAFDYIKSRHFRVVKVNGVVGGISRGELAMSFWSERSPIPQRMVFAVEEDGSLGDEVMDERVSRDAVIREVELCAIVDIDFATELAEWLQKHIAKYRETVPEPKKE